MTIVDILSHPAWSGLGAIATLVSLYLTLRQDTKPQNADVVSGIEVQNTSQVEAHQNSWTPRRPTILFLFATVAFAGAHFPLQILFVLEGKLGGWTAKVFGVMVGLMIGLVVTLHGIVSLFSLEMWMENKGWRVSGLNDSSSTNFHSDAYFRSELTVWLVGYFLGVTTTPFIQLL